MLGLLVCAVAARSYNLLGYPNVEFDATVANNYKHHDQQQPSQPVILHKQFD
jgi:hypothetical protein